MYRLIFVISLITLSFLVISTSALAKTTSNNKPGWGFGDTNHIHLGPPGQSVLPISQSNNATVNNNFTINSNSGGNISNNSSSIISSPSNIILSISNYLNENVLSIGE